MEEVRSELGLGSYSVVLAYTIVNRTLPLSDLLHVEV